MHDGEWARTDARARGATSRMAPGWRARSEPSGPSSTRCIIRPLGTVALRSATAVAHAPDGVVEGVEWPGDDWWMVGVQWHPEELTATPEPWDRVAVRRFHGRRAPTRPLQLIRRQRDSDITCRISRSGE